MTIEKLNTNGFEAEVLGKKRIFKYQVRNYVALKKKFNVDVYDMISNVLQGDLDAIIQMIWCGTLVFDKFDPQEPAKIKEELDVEKLYTIDYNELRLIGQEVCKGLLATLPKNTKKKTLPTQIKTMITRVQKILKIK